MEKTNAKCDLARGERSELENEVEVCRAKYARAERIVHQLEGENARWKEAVKVARDGLERLWGDTAIASAAMAYFGELSEAKRKAVVKDWQAAGQDLGIRCTEAASVRGILGDGVEIRDWTLHGLPNNTHCVDNGCIVTQARRWPLVIDPESQADTWLCSLENDNGLMTCQAASGEELHRRLAVALDVGAPTLIKGVTSNLPPILVDMLTFSTNPGNPFFDPKGKEVEYNTDFRLYMISQQVSEGGLGPGETLRGLSRLRV